MNIKIDSKNKTPYFKQIANQVITLIAKGELTGELPTVSNFSKSCNVSYSTILDVYTLLENDGYISLGRGNKRTVVQITKEDRNDIEKASGDLESILARYKLKGYSLDEMKDIIGQYWDTFKYRD